MPQLCTCADIVEIDCGIHMKQNIMLSAWRLALPVQLAVLATDSRACAEKLGHACRLSSRPPTEGLL